MRKLSFSVFFLLVLAFVGNAQSRSPQDFFGYELGSRFTFHHRIVDYFQFMAEHHSDRVRLIEYGRTYEGRPLLAVVMGSPHHMEKLEEIRRNHLSSIGFADSTPPSTSLSSQKPVIAWLSYNVHGDEAASSEAAMEVMYSLLETDARALLDHVLVIIDPCLNPDGHARYVDGYIRTTGNRANPSPNAIEHFQPWPGGRYNHYLFDLNRDWVWQVQKESQQRIAFYQRWMPHLHADFHEMGAGTTYYFPPAARPLHEDITPWQREFNEIVGEHNRRYFDKNNWLYFTKTSYDLFYPSYGDTWPMFNGAIGMTYEQGGGGRAGLALARPEFGDTLTLKTRVAHHVAASYATLEALADNRQKMKDAFDLFFSEAIKTPPGSYRTYLVKVKKQDARIAAFTSFLERQNIRYGRVGERFNANAVQLSTTAAGRVSFDADDLLITAHQPHARLLKVLFENSPMLEDSLTYDITSWGLGFVFGLDVYGIEQRREPRPYVQEVLKMPVAETLPYAYLVDWQATPQLRFLTDLLAKDVKVRTANRPFELAGYSFGSGALVLPRAGNEGLGKQFDELISNAAKKHGVSVVPVSTGMATSGGDLGSGQVKLLKKRNVALLSGAGVSPTAFGSIWHFLASDLDYAPTILSQEHITSNVLASVDVVILPDGNYASFLTDKRLGILNDWVRNGGKLIVMEGALDAFVDKPGWELERKSRRPSRDSASLLKSYATSARGAISDRSAGAIYEVSLDATHPLAFGYAEQPYYSSVRKVYDLDSLSDGWNVGHLDESAYRGGFVGIHARERLKNTLILGVREVGDGQVIYLADDPVFRGFWENGKLLFGNAVFR